MRIIPTLTMLALALALPAMAQTPTAPTAPGPQAPMQQPEGHGHKMMGRMAEKLKLTDAQKASCKDIMAKHKPALEGKGKAAKEARKGEGFPMLVVCGFAFDPLVGEETRQWPNLTNLITRMNPDLAMDTADQKLLKSTGAGNLFMVFGEPDLELRTLADGKLQVELRGLDVYDPTTGAIRSNTTDEIACWFIDTDYNEESFFVRHAYFTGADEPYKKLQRALKAEIDEDAWATLYSTVSRPFEAPSTGKIAVKVINHYGDEVLKVYGASGLPLEPS